MSCISKRTLSPICKHDFFIPVFRLWVVWSFFFFLNTVPLALGYFCWCCGRTLCCGFFQLQFVILEVAGVAVLQFCVQALVVEGVRVGMSVCVLYSS